MSGLGSFDRVQEGLDRHDGSTLVREGQGSQERSGRVLEGPWQFQSVWRVQECAEGFREGLQYFWGVFYGLKGSGRIQEGQRGSGRVQEVLGVLGGSFNSFGPKIVLAQNIFDQYLYGPNIFWDPNVFLVPKLFLAQHFYGTKTVWTWIFFYPYFLWFSHKPSWTQYLGL